MDSRVYVFQTGLFVLLLVVGQALILFEGVYMFFTEVECILELSVWLAIFYLLSCEPPIFSLTSICKVQPRILIHNFRLLCLRLHILILIGWRGRPRQNSFDDLTRLQLLTLCTFSIDFKLLKYLDESIKLPPIKKHSSQTLTVLFMLTISTSLARLTPRLNNLYALAR